MTYLASSPRRAPDGKPIYPHGAAPWGLYTEQQLLDGGKRPGGPLRAYVEGGKGTVALYSDKTALPLDKV